MPIITTAGENLIAQRLGDGQPLGISRFILANISGLDTNADENPAESLPAPAAIVFDAAPTKAGYINDNMVVYSQLLDSTVGDFDYNWIGLATDDDVLVAVDYVPLINKFATAGGVTGNSQTRNFVLRFLHAQTATGLTINASTWQIDLTGRIAGIDDRERKNNRDIYGSQAFYGNGFRVAQAGAAYSLAAGVGYVAGIRVEQAIATPLMVPVKPSAVWLDVSLQGDISSAQTVVDIVVDANPHPHYIDGNGVAHFVEKIADIAAGGQVTDTRTVLDSSQPMIQHFLRRGKNLSDIPNKPAARSALSVPSVDEVAQLLEGKAATNHSHDERYFTEAEMVQLLLGKSSTNHNHDGRYYTEAEINQRLAQKSEGNHSHDERYFTQEEINTLLEGMSGNDHHHDGRYYTEDQVNDLLSGKATSTHEHDGRYYTKIEMEYLFTFLSQKTHQHDDRYYTQHQANLLIAQKAALNHDHWEWGLGTEPWMRHKTSGFMIQLGTASFPPNQTSIEFLPNTFNTACRSVVLYPNGAAAITDRPGAVTARLPGSFNFQNNHPSYTFTCDYIAIGY